MRVNEQTTSHDPAVALRNEEGTFLLQRAGQTAIVTAQRGHSIKSWRSVGAVEPVNLLTGANPPYTIQKLANEILQSAEADQDSEQYNRAQREFQTSGQGR